MNVCIFLRTWQWQHQLHTLQQLQVQDRNSTNYKNLRENDITMITHSVQAWIQPGFHRFMEIGQHPCRVIQNTPKGHFVESKSKTFPGGVLLEASTFGARDIRKRSSFCLDPRLGEAHTVATKNIQIFAN